jgi:hypothetical protein
LNLVRCPWISSARRSAQSPFFTAGKITVAAQDDLVNDSAFKHASGNGAKG